MAGGIQNSRGDFKVIKLYRYCLKSQSSIFKSFKTDRLSQNYLFFFMCVILGISRIGRVEWGGSVFNVEVLSYHQQLINVAVLDIHFPDT